MIAQSANVLTFAADHIINCCGFFSRLLLVIGVRRISITVDSCDNLQLSLTMDIDGCAQFY